MTVLANKTSHLCFEVFANELRFKIIKLLFEKERAVLEIAALLKAEQSRVSHALNVLKQCYFVGMKKQGKQRIYFIPDKVKEIFSLSEKNEASNLFELMDKHISNYCKHGCKRRLEAGF